MTIDSLFLIIGLVVISMFGFVLLYGAPYLPTLTARKQEALDLLDLKPGQLLLELGSGDSRLQIEAAKRGIKSIGYELNPLLVMYAKVITFKYRKLATVKLANFWHKPLTECDGVYVFLLQPYMPKLHKKITQEITKSVKVVSYAFEIPGMKPVTEVNGLYLYQFKSKN